MWKAAAILPVVVFFALAGLPQEKQGKKEPAPQAPPAELKIPPEEAKRPNPVKPEPSSIAEGGRLFATQCAMCHGKEGDGKGDLAQDMQLKLHDYRDPVALKDVTDGELFYILAKGKGQMPGQGDRMSEKQCWHLINFIRSLAKKEPAHKPAESKPPA